MILFTKAENEKWNQLKEKINLEEHEKLKSNTIIVQCEKRLGNINNTLLLTQLITPLMKLL
jgi:hypothetical protein